MKSWKKPTPEQVDKVVAQLAHGEHHRYFFDRLENPEWLTPLREKGFFKSPPLPIPDESGATVALPVWPESRYLARMAKLAPETVLEILAQIPDTENARVHDDLAEAALTMPAKVAASIVPKAINWIRSPFKLLLPEKLGKLISHLALGGELKSALKLAKALLALRANPRSSQKVIEENRFLFPKPQPFFDLWHYGQILEKNVPDLVAAAGDKTLKLLCDLFERCRAFVSKK